MIATVTLDSLADLVDVAVVQRGFNADGLDRERGEVLSTKGWYNSQALINTRRMVLAPYDLIETMVECECGRKWQTAEWAAKHTCPAREQVRTRTRRN